MFWEVAGEIFGNPIGFIFTYFFGNLGGHVITVFTTALMLSLIVFPITLLGKGIFNKTKGGNFKKTVFTSIITTLISVIFIVIWSYLFNPTYQGVFVNGILSVIIGFIILNVITTIAIEIGLWFNNKMEKKWTMPEKLSIFLAVFCTIFLILGAYLLYLYISTWIKEILV